MIQLYPIVDELVSLLERKASIFTHSFYDELAKRVKKDFKEVIKTSVVIDKYEYLELLETKLYVLINDMSILEFKINQRTRQGEIEMYKKYQEQITEIRNKIKKLKEI